jgi:hypothetical protein
VGKLIVVENDKVEGTDKHNVSGNATNPAPPPPTVPYAGVGDFDYIGKMTVKLSDFVKINGSAVVLKNSKSKLNPGEDVAPTGKHSGPMGSNFNPPSPVPIAASLTISEPVGEGNPSASSGSAFVKVAGVEVILDGDNIDTCDGLRIPMNSIVTAENQDFVFCAE